MSNIKILFLLFLSYSFLGWIMETIYCSLTNKKIANRGFLVGPICPIYGVGAISMLLFLHKYVNDHLTLFIMSVIVCSIIEYFTSYIMEKLFNTRWWDYSTKKFNINGRICLSNAVCFGALGLLLIYFINPLFLNIISSFSPLILNILFWFFFTIFIFDFIFSFIIISKFTKTVRLVKKDSSNDINKKVKDFLISKSKLYNRLIKAFPNFKLNKK